MTIKDYWINEIQQIKDFGELGSTEDSELSFLKNEIVSLFDDQFIQTATETGIAKREKMLHLQPFADDTLNSRRFRVATKWTNRPPYTHRQLLAKLNQLVGTGGYYLTLNHANYTLDILVDLGVKRQLEDVKTLVKDMSPANLLITVDLRYNRYSDLAAFTHAQLAAYTHTQLRNEVIS